MMMGVMLCFSACKKEPVAPTPTPDSPTEQPDQPQLPFVDNAMVCNGTTYGIDHAYSFSEGGQTEYLFVHGSYVTPKHIFYLLAPSDLAPGTYPLLPDSYSIDAAGPDVVQGQWAVVLQAINQYPLASGTLTLEELGGRMRYRVVAVTQQGDSILLSFDGDLEPLNGTMGQGSIEMDGQSFDLAFAYLYTLQTNMGPFSTLALYLRDDNVLHIEFAQIGTSIPLGEQEIHPSSDASAGYLLGGLVKGSQIDYFTGGQFSLAQEGDTYTVQASGSTASGLSFTLHYTGAATTLSKLAPASALVR